MNLINNDANRTKNIHWKKKLNRIYFITNLSPVDFIHNYDPIFPTLSHPYLLI